MKLVPSVLVLAFTRTVLALPIRDLETRADPSNGPVTILGMTKTGFKCGSDSWTTDDIYKAISAGTQLNVINETRGKNKYPHTFGNKENTPLDPKCKQGDPNMKEFPIVKGGKYTGGDPGADRVVYLHSSGESDNIGHPQSTYCGIMTHTGAPANPKNGFVGCKAI